MWRWTPPMSPRRRPVRGAAREDQEGLRRALREGRSGGEVAQRLAPVRARALSTAQERSQLEIRFVRRLLGRIVSAGQHPSADIGRSFLPGLDRPVAAIDVAAL